MDTSLQLAGRERKLRSAESGGIDFHVMSPQPFRHQLQAPPSEPPLWQQATPIDASKVHSDTTVRNMEMLTYIYVGVFVFFVFVISVGICFGFRTSRSGSSSSSSSSSSSGGGDVHKAEDCTDYLKIPD